VIAVYLIAGLVYLGNDRVVAQTAYELEHGSISARAAALAEIVRLPPEQRSLLLIAAVEREARRMEPIVLRGGSDESTHYAAGLIKVLAEAQDPTAVPVLIDYAGRTSFAIDGLVSLGDVAIPSMLRVARNGDLVEDLDGRRTGVLIALRRALEGPRLSETARQDIFKLGDLLLGKRRLWLADIMWLSEIALMSNRADLLAVVEQLANDRNAWVRHGVRDPAAIEVGQKFVRGRLQVRKR
jgi:hypothetical protein